MYIYIYTFMSVYIYIYIYNKKICKCTKSLLVLNIQSNCKAKPNTVPVQTGHTFAMCLGEVFLRGRARGPCALAAVVQSALIPCFGARSRYGAFLK